MAKKAPDPLFKPAVEVWFDFYRAKTGEEYVFDKKDGMHLKQLLKKVATKTKQKNIEDTPENIINGVRGFLFSITDRWVLEHLEISIVNSKFNTLYVSAVKTNPFTAASRIDDLVDQRYSSGANQQGGGNKATG